VEKTWSVWKLQFKAAVSCLLSLRVTTGARSAHVSSITTSHEGACSYLARVTFVPELTPLSLCALHFSSLFLVLVRFQVFTAASIKMTVFWDVVPCSLVEIGCRFGGAYCLHHQGDGPHDVGSKYLWNVSQFISDQTAQRFRRQSSSFLFYSARERKGKRHEERRKKLRKGIMRNWTENTITYNNLCLHSLLSVNVV
jgi:hypothetical protein